MIEIKQKVHSRRNLSLFHIELSQCSTVRYLFPSFNGGNALFQQERSLEIHSNSDPSTMKRQPAQIRQIKNCENDETSV